ncbi:hypothetical protein EDC94DRAFT_620617, partial [Helicostylum pulchrum]
MFCLSPKFLAPCLESLAPVILPSVIALFSSFFKVASLSCLVYFSKNSRLIVLFLYLSSTVFAYDFREAGHSSELLILDNEFNKILYRKSGFRSQYAKEL